MGRKPKNAEGGRQDAVVVDKAERKVMEAVAKHMRYKVATKSAVIRGQKVEYFSGAKAVDCLMNSKWTSEPKSPDSIEPYFLNRTFAVDYCNKLLRADFFVRAEKVDLKHGDMPTTSGDAASSSGKEGKAALRKRGEKTSDSPRPKKQGDESGGSEKKTKRKFRLDIHRQQVFMDSKEEVYFWKYDPPSYSTYMIGFAVVLGAVAMTLQPLWPESSRHGLWYLSVAALGIMGVMVALIIFRWIVYGVVFVATGGKLSFWILPNLDNEKASFFESFKPLHSVEWAKEKKKSKKKQQDAVKAEKEHGSGSEREAEGDLDSGTKLENGTDKEDQSLRMEPPINAD